MSSFPDGAISKVGVMAHSAFTTDPSNSQQNSAITPAPEPSTTRL